MSKTLAAAELAALEGRNDDFDSQHCRNLQAMYLSSSPPTSPQSQNNASQLEVNNTTSLPSTPSRLRKQWGPVESGLEEEEEEDIQIVFTDEEEEPIVLAMEVLPSSPSAAMAKGVDDFTQKSAMSATQENPESLYERYGIVASTSTHTNTYGENDTGHVHFDSFIKQVEASEHKTPEDAAETNSDPYNENEDISPEPSSQSTPMPAPRTPATVRNPFSQPGTLLKGHEMFGTTQPSSVRNIPSGASSRPSISGFPPSSPIQSSVRQLLRSKSLEPTPQTSEPRPYVSMKESQERHKTSNPFASQHSDSDTESDSDIELDMRTKRKQREARIERETSGVVQPRPIPISLISSPNVVEVPSTGSKERRRSVEEEYIAQCSGTDAQDTEEDHIAQCGETDARDIQEDRIADSQNEIEQLPMYSTAQSHLPEGESHPLPKSSLQSGLIPETSPTKPDDNGIRPMGDIVSLSAETETQDLIDVPGFTQDLEFENVIRPFSSPPSFSQQPDSSPTKRRPPKTRQLFKKTGLKDGTVSTVGDDESVTAAVKLIIGDKIAPNGGDTQISNQKDKEDGVAVGVDREQQTSVEEGIKIVSSPQMEKENGDITVEEYNRDTSMLEGDTTMLQIDTTMREVHQQDDMSIDQCNMGKHAPIVPPASALSTPLSSAPPSTANSLLDNSSLSPAASTRSSSRRPKRPAEELLPTRASKRLSTRDLRNSRDSSIDPLAGPTPAMGNGLFSNMAFAVTYKNDDDRKADVIKQITSQGGLILKDLSDLFEQLSSEDNELKLSSLGKQIGFVGTISDVPSRLVKYIEALALGLPCLSGHWISKCIDEGKIVDWAQYLLSSGQSELSGTYHSRLLQPYPAANATFREVFAVRSKILDRYSILRVAGKRIAEKKKPYLFLMHILEPARMLRVTDYAEARKQLVEFEKAGDIWDMVYVEDEQKADVAIFDPPTKTKKGQKDEISIPKRVRLISHRVIVESLIVGKLL